MDLKRLDQRQFMEYLELLIFDTEQTFIVKQLRYICSEYMDCYLYKTKIFLDNI